MEHPHGRYTAYIARLRDAVLTRAGQTAPELRRAVFERAAGGRSTGGEDLVSYVEKVARHAYHVTDDDLGRLRQAGYSDDALFEVTVAAALGAALGRLERGLAALRSSPPGPLSTDVERGN